MIVEAIEACAQGWEVVVAGQRLRLAPLTLAEWIELESAARKARPPLLDQIVPRLEGQPPERQRQMLAAAYDAMLRGGHVTLDELWTWLHTTAGRVHLVWLSARRQHPGLTLAAVAKLAGELSPREWQRLDALARRDLEYALGN